MNIAAFDLSLSATGFAVNFEAEVSIHSGVIECTKLRGTPRLRFIRDAVCEVAALADLVVIEGYAFARPNQAHQLGELGGIVRVALYELGRPPIEVPPASIKLFAGGRGNATKDEMLAAAIRRLDYDGHDHNEADALWLLRMTECGVGIRTPENDHQRRALAKMTWPVVAAADGDGV